MRVLEGLQPAAALGFFETLCAIPHGSRDTKAISDYCVRFAQERGLSSSASRPAPAMRTIPP